MIRQEHNAPSIYAARWTNLETKAREGIQSMLQDLLDAEVTEFLARPRYARRASSAPERVFRNGHGKPRRLSLTSGTITVRRPRIRGLEERFESRILPMFARRTEEVAALIPELYLHGLALRDFDLALRGLLGDAAPLSPASVARLKARWQEDYEAWRQSPITEQVVYLWADGIYVKAGLEKEKAALLTVIAGMRDGTKRVLAVSSGYRESKDSWAEVLRELVARGMSVPKLVIADGHLGLWAALAELGWGCGEQRCWNHKMRNVLDALPKKEQPAGKEMLSAMQSAETQEEAMKLRDRFVVKFKERAPKACEKLNRDWARLMSFYNFPKEHWKHLRTSNVVESPFAAVRLRTGASKRFKRTENAEAMIWKLLTVAEKRFRKLNAPQLLAEVAAGVVFENGIRKTNNSQAHAA
jgi:transposase-like protein